MPTKPFEPLLYRDLARVSAKDTIDIASPLLQELVNYGTNAFQRCQTSTTGTKDEDLHVLTLYLHIIEMTDRIEVLLSQSCPITAIPLLRSSFEALLAIDYILQADYQRRSFAWMLGYVHQRLALYETQDLSTQAGKEFRKALQADRALRSVALPDPSLAKQAVDNLQRLLRKPDYQIVVAEYERLKKTKKRKPACHSLFEGPTTLRELATRVNRGAQYDFLYRLWSGLTHAGDLSRYLTRTSGGVPAIRPLRNPEGIREVSSMAASFILDATRKLLGKYRPGEETSFARWYVREVRERYFALYSKLSR